MKIIWLIIVIELREEENRNYNISVISENNSIVTNSIVNRLINENCISINNFLNNKVCK
jgi:hypothetical protein